MRFKGLMHALTSGIAALAMAALIGACGGGDSAPPPAPAAAKIGAAGGTVDGPMGSRVVVAAGALSADVDIAIAASSNGAPALPAGFVSMGTMFAFTPHGTAFAVPATVSLPVEAGMVPPGSTPLLFKTNAQGQWEQVPGAAVQGNTVVASVSAFSWFNLGQLPPGILTQPVDVTVLAPATATFGVTATSDATGYQWQRSSDGGTTWFAIPGATADTFTTAATSSAPVANGGDNGARFRVVVTSASGSSMSRAAVLTVSAAPAHAGLRIAAGGSFSIAALASGAVRSWGQHDWLGDPSATVDRTAPGPVPGLGAVVNVAAGSLHVLAVTANGEVWGWGYNGFGQLGDGNGAPGVTVTAPMRITTLANVVAVAAGHEHSVFLKSDGTVWTAGSNDVGQLGNGFNTASNVPVQVPIANVVAISSIADHTLALKSDGTVWAWGLNLGCQLGNVSGATACTNQRTPVQVLGVTDAIAIAAGDTHSLAVVRAAPGNAFGSIWGWGVNLRGQLGISVSTPQVKPARLVWDTPAATVVAGHRHSLVIHFDGTVFAFGDNLIGQLGDPAFTAGFSDQPRWVSALSGAVAGSAGDTNLVQLGDGSLWAWGGNANGQVGNGSAGAVPVAAPTRIGGLNLN